MAVTERRRRKSDKSLCSRRPNPHFRGTRVKRRPPPWPTHRPSPSPNRPRHPRVWLEASGIESGPVFRPINRHGQILPTRLSDRAVALIVKRAAQPAGKDPAEFAGHSLRSGLATAAAIGGASERAIMNQTGHRSTAMVRRYIRDGSLFRENAAARVGL